MSAPNWSREQLIAANEDAATFYRRQLLGPDGEGPRDYLTHRGFHALLNETRWTVGYAPAGWTGLHEHLAELGYSDDCQLAAGLVTLNRRGTPIDRFRDRVTFGIRDVDRALVGFVARSSPAAPQSAPKYLNTPTTAIYNKSRLLYGAGEQADRLRQGATPVLVEGPLDAMAIELTSTTSDNEHAGLALCGTALTDHHVDAALIGTPTKVALIFDPDRAGHAALRNAYDRLHSHVENLDAILPPTGHDPAETYERGGPAALRRNLGQARPAADIIIDLQLDSWPAEQTGAEADLARLRETAALIVQMADPDVARQGARLTHVLPFDHATIARELVEAVTRSRTLRTSAPPARHHPGTSCVRTYP